MLTDYIDASGNAVDVGYCVDCVDAGCCPEQEE